VIGRGAWKMDATTILNKAFNKVRDQTSDLTVDPEQYLLSQKKFKYKGWRKC
jgi:hypothetical protein